MDQPLPKAFQTSFQYFPFHYSISVYTNVNQSLEVCFLVMFGQIDW